VDAAERARSSATVAGALEWARSAHRSGENKGVDHPAGVAAKLLDSGFDDEVIAAALLHDTVEDGEADLGGIRDRFGGRVAALVDAMTEDASIPDWEQRKIAHRAQVAACGRDAAAIYGGDKLMGVCTLRSEYGRAGEDAVATMKAPTIDARLRTWEGDLEMLRRLEPPLPFLAELETELAALRAERDRTGAPSPAHTQR